MVLIVGVPLGILWLINDRHGLIPLGMTMPKIEAEAMNGDSIGVSGCSGKVFSDELECTVRAGWSGATELHYEAFELTSKGPIKLQAGKATMPFLAANETGRMRIKFDNIHELDSLYLWR
jgi:hypothetical protein